MAPPAMAAAPDGSVPAPTRAFTPRTAVAFYADVQSASKSAIWNAMTNKAAPLMEQLQSMQRAQMSSLSTPQALPGFQGTDAAEIAIAIEGEKILSDLQSGRFDPSSGFVVAIRLSRTTDVEKLIQEGLEDIAKEKPGLRGPIEKSRRRIGVAEAFDIPAEALGEHKLPFTVSVALGPGKDGTIIAIGRSENLQAFLTGKTEGKLRGQVNDQLSRRGQIWLHLPVPPDVAKGLSGGSGSNPMLAGLAESMDKVRDISLSLNFGASQIDFALDFGCADGAAATQLSQGLQGLLGMIQIGAQQNPASAPPFIGKIKAAAEGATFRLTTAFTMRDFDLAFKNANRGVAAARPQATPRATPAPKPEAAPAASRPPVDVEFVQFSSDVQESLRPAKLRVQNRSSRPVKELKLTFTYLDEAGRKLGQWTRNHSGLTAESLVGGETTGIVDCLAFNVPAGAKKLTVTLHEVTFTDGEKWKGN